MPSAGGKPTLVTDDGALPQFGAASDRLYLMRFGDEDRRSLVSLTLAGADLRTHATSEAATEFRLSPGRQVARLQRTLERLRDAVRAHRQGGRSRSESERRAGDAGVEGRRRRAALVGRCAQSPLVAGAGALLARPQGGLRLRGRRAGEAPGAAGRRRAPRLRLHLCEARWTDGAGRRPDRDPAAPRTARRTR